MINFLLFHSNVTAVTLKIGRRYTLECSSFLGVRCYISYLWFSTWCSVLFCVVHGAPVVQNHCQLHLDRQAHQKVFLLFLVPVLIHRDNQVCIPCKLSTLLICFSRLFFSVSRGCYCCAMGEQSKIAECSIIFVTWVVLFFVMRMLTRFFPSHINLVTQQ